MVLESTTHRVLRLFFDFPTRYFQLREVSREIGLGLPSVSNHVRILLEEGFLIKEKRGTYAGYVASQTDRFKLFKQRDMILRLHASGLLEILEDIVAPDAIVLFGSAARGEDVEGSDIDLLVVADESEVDMGCFDEVLGRKVSLHFEPNPKGLPSELLNNVINGIVLNGFVKVVG